MPSRPLSDLPEWLLDAENRRPEDRYGQYITRRLKSGMRRGDWSVQEIARQTLLSPSTIHSVVHGVGYPDIRTVARIEIATRIRLLPAFYDRSNLGVMR